jgi:AraC-like DNA-binding protein
LKKTGRIDILESFESTFNTGYDFSMKKMLLLTAWYLVTIAGAVRAEKLWEFPGATSLWHCFTDASSGGNSESYGAQIGDSSVTWSFQLKNSGSSLWPFTGISRTVTAAERKGIEDNDSLIIELRSAEPLRITFRLSTFDPEITRQDSFQSWRMLEYPIEIKEHKQRITIPLKAFKVSDWWKRRYKVATADNRLFLGSIGRIEIVINDPHYCNRAQTIEMYSVMIRHRNRSFIPWAAAIVAVLLTGAIGFLIFNRRRKKVSPQPDSLQINPSPVAAPLSEWNRILEYLQSRYTDSQVNLQQVGAALGISESRLSRIINERYPEGFRCLLHEFRVKEGMRLLKETEMNISEIAYKLGYATPNHFNREFKKRTQLSPGSFRKS